MIHNVHCLNLKHGKSSLPYNVKTIVYDVTFCSRPEFVKRGLELNIGFLFQELLYFMSLILLLMFHNSVALNIYVEFYLI